MRYMFLLLILGALGCEVHYEGNSSNEQLTKVVVKDVIMTDHNRLRYIVRTPDGKESKTAKISANIDYVPIIGETVYVSNWSGGIFGYAQIEKVEKPVIQAEIEE